MAVRGVKCMCVSMKDFKVNICMCISEQGCMFSHLCIPLIHTVSRPPSGLPSGPVQHLTVSGDVGGDVANLFMNWSAPVKCIQMEKCGRMCY